MDTRNRKYYVIDNVNEATYSFVKDIMKIPSVKCKFRATRPYLLIGCATNREQELLYIYNKFFANTKSKFSNNVLFANGVNAIPFDSNFIKAIESSHFDIQKTQYLCNVLREAIVHKGYIVRLETSDVRTYLPNKTYMYNHWCPLSNAKILNSYLEAHTLVDKINDITNTYVSLFKGNGVVESQDFIDLQRKIFALTKEQTFLKRCIVEKFKSALFNKDFKLSVETMEIIV